MNPIIDFGTDYIRLVCYAIIVLSSIVCFRRGSVNKPILVGNIVMAIALTISLIQTNIFKIPGGMVRDLIITPATMIWAIINFREVVR